MPTAMTFNSLQADVTAYLERGSINDPTVYAQLPELINFGERRISRELNILGFLVPVVFTFQANVAVIAKPDRWRKTASMDVASAATGTSVRNQVFKRSYEYIRMYWPDDTQTWSSVYGAPGPPQFYADYDYNHFIVAPTPDQAYPAELKYYEEPALLDSTNQTNFITQYMPNLLLYSTLLECTPFIKNDARIATWTQLYDRAAAVISAEDTGQILDRATNREKD